MGVGAQSTLGGQDIFVPKIVWEINKMPEFYVIFAGKIIKMPQFLWYLREKLTKFPNFTDFCQKTPEFYVIWPKNIFYEFLGEGGARAPSSVSYAYGGLWRSWEPNSGGSGISKWGRGKRP